MPLSGQLRTTTSAAHLAAEGTPFVTQLMAGTLSLADYCRMMVNLYAIYDELERQLERNAADPSIRHIASSHLARRAAIEADLVQLMGRQWRESGQLETATSSYLDRLQSIGLREPPRLVAHAYVRYMGDLSGGQMMSRAVRPMLGANADQALHFYHFGSSSEVAALKARFRDGLDRIGAESESLGASIIEEALIAFKSAKTLFEQLARKSGTAPSG
jgi:heme oxygenase